MIIWYSVFYEVLKNENHCHRDECLQRSVSFAEVINHVVLIQTDCIAQNDGQWCQPFWLVVVLLLWWQRLFDVLFWDILTDEILEWKPDCWVDEKLEPETERCRVGKEPVFDLLLRIRRVIFVKIDCIVGFIPRNFCSFFKK